jgi:hypothetical protein
MGLYSFFRSNTVKNANNVEHAPHQSASLSSPISPTKQISSPIKATRSGSNKIKKKKRWKWRKQQYRYESHEHVVEFQPTKAEDAPWKELAVIRFEPTPNAPWHRIARNETESTSESASSREDVDERNHSAASSISSTSNDKIVRVRCHRDGESSNQDATLDILDPDEQYTVQFTPASSTSSERPSFPISMTKTTNSAPSQNQRTSPPSSPHRPLQQHSAQFQYPFRTRTIPRARLRQQQEQAPSSLPKRNDRIREEPAASNTMMPPPTSRSMASGDSSMVKLPVSNKKKDDGRKEKSTISSSIAAYEPFGLQREPISPLSSPAASWSFLSQPDANVFPSTIAAGQATTTTTIGPRTIFHASASDRALHQAIVQQQRQVDSTDTLLVMEEDDDDQNEETVDETASPPSAMPIQLLSGENQEEGSSGSCPSATSTSLATGFFTISAPRHFMFAKGGWRKNNVNTAKASTTNISTPTTIGTTTPRSTEEDDDDDMRGEGYEYAQEVVHL